MTSEITPGYMSGALTGLAPEVRKLTLAFYEEIANVAAEYGINLYLPHKHSDPVRDAGFTPVEVYRMDEARIREAHLMVAEVSQSSLGVGAELVMAWQFGTNVVLIGQRDRLEQLKKDPVESIIFENPAIQFIIAYEEPKGALEQFGDLLEEKSGELKVKGIFPPIPDFHTTFVLSGRKVRWQGRNRQKTYFDPFFTS